MKNDMQRTNIEELKVENELCMYEMERLRQHIQNASNTEARNADISNAVMAADAKGKPQLLIKRLQGKWLVAFRLAPLPLLL